MNQIWLKLKNSSLSINLIPTNRFFYILISGFNYTKPLSCSFPFPFPLCLPHSWFHASWTFLVFYAVLFGFREPPWAIGRNAWRDECRQIISDKRIQLSSKAKDAHVVWMNLAGKNGEWVCSELYKFLEKIWYGW